MKEIKRITLAFVVFLLLAACASSKKQTYTAEELAAFKSFLDSKSYLFKARWAKPLASQGLSSIANTGLLGPGNSVGQIDIFNMVNTMEIKGDTVVADLPFYGERRTGASFNPQESGIKFEEEPKDFEITFNEKKQGYAVNFMVSDGTENYQVTGMFFPNRTGSIFINSNQRQSIGFTGSLLPLEEE